MSIKTLAGAALLVISTKAAAAPFFLSCDLQFEYDKSRMSVDYKIDEEKQTVNGYPATFTDTSITFDLTVNGVPTLTVISRLTGRVRVSSKSDIIAQGGCTIASTKKF